MIPIKFQSTINTKKIIYLIKHSLIKLYEIEWKDTDMFLPAEMYNILATESFNGCLNVSIVRHTHKNPFTIVVHVIISKSTTLKGNWSPKFPSKKSLWLKKNSIATFILNNQLLKIQLNWWCQTMLIKV